jgi:hypothetical protein
MTELTPSVSDIQEVLNRKDYGEKECVSEDPK